MRGEVAAPVSALCSLRGSDARSSPWSQLRRWVEEENEAGNDLRWDGGRSRVGRLYPLAQSRMRPGAQQAQATMHIDFFMWHGRHCGGKMSIRQGRLARAIPGAL